MKRKTFKSRSESHLVWSATLLQPIRACRERSDQTYGFLEPTNLSKTSEISFRTVRFFYDVFHP